MARPRIGVSRCLLGEAVRHDGRDKRFAWLVDELASHVELISICPEVELGLGVPREPVHLVAEPGRIALRGVDSDLDLTDRMRTWAQTRVEQISDLDGYITKARSPSCALGDATITFEDGSTELANGMFVDALLARFPDLAIEDERRLEDPAIRAAFLARVTGAA